MANSTEQWEDGLARKLGAPHVLSFAFARTALTAVLQASGLTRGDEVILSPVTCKVVPLALLSLGLRPIFADVSERTLNLNPKDVERRIRGATRAILFQHTYGGSDGFEKTAAVASQHELLLVEDAAQCMPRSAAGPFPRRGSAAALFSMNLMKPLAASAGGALATTDAGLAAKIRRIRNALPRPTAASDFALAAEAWAHRLLLGPRTYWPLLGAYSRVAGGYRQQAIEVEIRNEIERTAGPASRYQVRCGLASLGEVETVSAARLRCCERYDDALADRPEVETPLARAGLPLYGYPLFVDDKRRFLERAKRKLLEVVAWPGMAPIYPLDSLDELGAYGYKAGSCPVAERVARRVVLLPTHGGVSARVQQRLIDLLPGE